MNDHALTVLGRHIIASALEEDYDDHTPDDVDWEYRGWDVERVDGHDEVIEVVGTQEDYQTRGGTFNARVWGGTIRVHVRVDYTDKSLAGEFETHIEWVGGVPSPPDPEPQWREL
jgi:hypothetical protein